MIKLTKEEWELLRLYELAGAEGMSRRKMDDVSIRRSVPLLQAGLIENGSMGLLLITPAGSAFLNA